MKWMRSNKESKPYNWLIYIFLVRHKIDRIVGLTAHIIIYGQIFLCTTFNRYDYENGKYWSFDIPIGQSFSINNVKLYKL